jgi:hypothetical protein
MLMSRDAVRRVVYATMRARSATTRSARAVSEADARAITANRNATITRPPRRYERASEPGDAR